jgi:hypothetical protein
VEPLRLHLLLLEVLSEIQRVPAAPIEQLPEEAQFAGEVPVEI